MVESTFQTCFSLKLEFFNEISANTLFEVRLRTPLAFFFLPHDMVSCFLLEKIFIGGRGVKRQ